LAEAPAYPAHWASICVAHFLAMPMGLLNVIFAMLAHWIYTSSLGLLQSIYFTFTSCCAHRPASCHSCHVGPLGLLPIFLGFHSPFTLLFHLIVPMGLLAVVLVVLAHWVYYLFSWVSTAHLLYFHSSTSIFLSPSPIIGLLLPLCFLSKMGINNRHSNSHHKLLQVGHNFLILYHFPFFLFSFFQRTLRFKILV